MNDINELRIRVEEDGKSGIDLEEIHELLDRIEAAEKEHDALRAKIASSNEAWKSADRACRDLTEKVIPNLREQVEAAEKERDSVAQQLVQSEIGKREISEAHSAVTRRLSVLVVENIALRAKIAEMEKQEPVAWRTFDGEGGYDYRSYEDNENYKLEWDARNPNHIGWVEPLRLAIGAQPAPSAPTIEAELLRQNILELVNQYGDERAIEAYHGDLHCRKAPKDLFAEIERALEKLSARQLVPIEALKK